MKNNVGNFVSNIHDTSYEEVYYSKMLTSEGMLCDYYREKESLNGFWNFGIDQYDNCLRSKWYEENYYDESGRPYPMDFSFDAWDAMKVPSCWNTQGEKYFYYEGSVVFTRTFRYINKGEKRVFLKFGGINYEAKVFLNKKYMGMHKGGSTPFYIEVTDALEENNRIIVVANNTRKRTNVPCENTDWFNYGGIYRDVELIRLPETFIKDLYISLVPKSDYKRIEVSVTVDGSGKNGTAKLRIDELKVNTQIDIRGGIGRAVIAASPELWCPENPKLYDVIVEYGEDILKEKIGFREIRTEGTDIYLNGKKIYLKGVSAHEESVLNGKAVTVEEIRENYSLAREMNCNYMRLAHYPHSEMAARIADEVGIMLWEEIPVYWAIEFGNNETYKDAENQLCELILRDRNRASVIIWSVGNENSDTDERLHFMSSLAKKARELDPARLVSAACLVDHTILKIADRLAEYVDVIGINEYYGWYDPDFSKLGRIFENSRPEKPVIISEFGADAKAGVRGTIDDLHTEDNQAEIYRKQIATIREIPYVKGISPWILFDFRCPRRLQKMQNYYNIKGLLSADKRYKKLSFDIMKRFYETIE